MRQRGKCFLLFGCKGNIFIEIPINGSSANLQIEVFFICGGHRGPGKVYSRHKVRIIPAREKLYLNCPAKVLCGDHYVFNCCPHRSQRPSTTEVINIMGGRRVDVYIYPRVISEKLPGLEVIPRG